MPRAWAYAVLALLACQAFIWLMLPQPVFPSVNAVSQLGDMEFWLRPERVANSRLMAPWHPLASLLTAPGVWASENALGASRYLWLLLQLAGSAAAALLAIRAFTPLAGIACLVLMTLSAQFYEYSYALSSETCAFLFAALTLCVAGSRSIQGRWTRPALIGLLGGLTALARVEFAVVVPVALMADARQRSLRWPDVLRSLVTAGAVFAAVLSLQLYWVWAATGAPGLMPPYTVYATIGSAAHLVSDRVWDLWFSGALPSGWPGGADVLPVLQRAAWTLVRDTYSIGVKVLLVAAVIGLWLRRRSLSPLALGVLALALAIPLLNILAVINQGIDLSNRRLWSSAPFVFVLASFGAVVIIDSLRARVPAVAIGAVCVLIAIFAGPWQARDLAQQYAASARDARNLQLLREHVTGEPRPVVTSSMTMAYALGAEFAPPYLATMSSPQAWIAGMRAFGAQYLVRYDRVETSPSGEERRFEQEVDAILRGAGASLYRNEDMEIFDFRRVR